MKNRDAKKRIHNSPILKTKRKKVKNIKQEEFNESLVLKNFEKEKELNEYTDLKTTVLQNLPWDDSDIEITKQTSILIIDDDESICKTMSLILEKKGHTIDIAKTGEEAIKKAQERYFNMAILDIKLPDIEGVELIKPLKKINPDIEIIVATGYASLETSMKALNEGAAYYITKPINMDEMLLTINRSFDKQNLKVNNRNLLKKVKGELVRRKKVEKKLLEITNQWRTTFNSMNDLVFILDKNQNIIRANNKASDFLGIPLEKIIGKKCYKLFHGKNCAIKNCPLKKLKSSKKRESTLLEIPEKDLFINVTVDPIFDKKNNLFGAVHIINDVTDKKKADEKIQNLAKFPEENANPVYRVSTEGVLLYANPASRKMILKDITKIGEKIPENWIEMIKNVYDSKKKQTLELKFGKRTYLFDQVPILGKDYVNVYCMDITMIKKSEKKLIESEKKYRSIVENINDSLIIHDFNWKILDINQNTEKMLNFKREELIGKNLKKIRVEENSVNYNERIKQLVKNEKLIFDNYLLKKDKKPIPVTISTKLVTKKGNGIIQSFVRDITERKKAEDDLKERMKELNGLYKIRELLIEQGSDLERVFNIFVNDIAPASMQFPEKAYAIIEIDGKRYFNFGKNKKCDSKNYLIAPIIVNNNKRGELKIGYIEDIPFIEKYEQNLVKSYAEIFGTNLENIEANEMVKNTELRLEYLVSQNPSVIYTSKVSGDYGATFISSNVNDTFGYKPEDFTMDSNFWINHIHQNDRERVLEGLSKLSINSKYIYEYRFKHKDGSIKWIRDEGKLIRDEKGKPKEIIGNFIDITEIKKREQEILNLKDYNVNILQSIKSGIVVTDTNFKVITWNNYMEDSFEIKNKEIIGKNIKDIILKFKNIKYEKIFQQIIKKGIIYKEYSVKIKTKNGIKFYNLNFAPRMDEKFNYIGILMSFDDVTELAKIGNKLTTIYDLTKNMMLARDENEIFSIGLDAIENVLKFNNVSILIADKEKNELSLKAFRGYGKKINKLKLELNNFNSISTNVFKSGITQNIGDVRKDKNYFMVKKRIRSELALPLKFGNKIIGVINIESVKINAFSENDEKLLSNLASEITIALTNRKLQKETQKRAESLAMLNKVGKVISSPLKLNDLYQTIYGQTTRLLNVNNFYITLNKKKIFDKTKGDFKEEEYLEFAYEIEGNQRIKKRSRKLRNGLTEYVIKTRKALLIKNNFKKTCKKLGISPRGRTSKTWLGVPLISKGIVIGVISIQDYETENAYDCEDKDLISNIADQAAVAIENAKLYEELKENYEKLQELDITKSDFLKVTSHEFGTPITILKGNIDMFLQGTFGELSDLQLDRINSLKTSVERLEKMRTQTLFLSKVDSGESHLKKEHFLLNEIINKVVDGIRIIAENNNQNIKTNLTETRIFADKYKITEIFENLLSNAIKYAGEGTLIEIDSKENKDDIHIIVKDNGEGIGKEYLKKIFERFEIAHGSMHHKQGTGLGLAIIKVIIESHGGKIWCESEKGKGCAFHFTIPKKAKNPE